jgi:integrase
MSKRAYGDGSFSEREPGIWPIRYRVGGKRVSATIRGTKKEAQAELRKLIHASDTGRATAPSKLTLGEWINRWLAGGAAGRRQRKVGRRTLEPYTQILRLHITPVLGDRPIQQLRSDEIDTFYSTLEGKHAPGTASLLHVVFGACLRAAVRQRVIQTSPMDYVSSVPSKEEADHGIALSEEDVRKLIAGFRSHPLYELVVTALHTGARRNELLALRWLDLDFVAKTLRIERSLERTPGRTEIKKPKTARGTRTIAVGDDLLAILRNLKETHLRLKAEVPDGADVDLGLIKLPEEALIFPAPSAERPFTTFRHPSTKVFAQRARKIGFPRLRFHDLRGTAITRMLTDGIPPHIVAKRHGHDTATMMRAYAKHIPNDDREAAQLCRTRCTGRFSQNWAPLWPRVLLPFSCCTLI